jgi:DNA-binding PadR family transcriptional regulator
MTQVTALILQALGAGHRYGFDIMDATGLASGTVYPALRRLEQAKLLRGRWEEAGASQRSGRPQRRFYELTRAGATAAAAASEKLAGKRAMLRAQAPAREV